VAHRRSQSAASSFSLNKSDSNPQDMVTDGTLLWVVDGSALKVFKYTLSSGKLLGSWSIDPANTHPTGITINPNNVSEIWIVVSGTLKVYDYTAAASRTSGSQNAASTFALASGDTNPQGIADPPPADMEIGIRKAFLMPITTDMFTPTTAATPNAVSSVSPAIVPSLSGRDALFALLSLSPDGPTLTGTRAGTSAGAQNALATLTSLTSGSGSAFYSNGSAVGLLAGTSTDDDSLETATDSVFAGRADDPASQA